MTQKLLKILFKKGAKKMKKILILLLTFILFSGCSNISETNENNKKLKVYTSFYAIYDLTKKISGDKAELYNIVPTGTEPHDWEPSVKDMLNIESADILFYNGASMESWIEKIKSSIENSNIEYAELSKDIELITYDEKNNNSYDIHNTDPHVWLNPQNAKKQMEIIKNVLSEKDPSNADYYEKNYKTESEKIDKLDSDFKQMVSNSSSKNIIVAHQAYGYLCEAYGLNQIAIEGISADSEPTPSKMAEIVTFAKQNNIKYIFFEELVSPKVAKTISKEIGAELLELNPFEGLTEEQIKNNEDYYSIMYKNLENIKKAIGE